MTPLIGCKKTVAIFEGRHVKTVEKMKDVNVLASNIQVKVKEQEQKRVEQSSNEDWPSLPAAGVFVIEKLSKDDSNIEQLFNHKTDAQFAEGSGIGDHDMIIDEWPNLVTETGLTKERHNNTSVTAEDEKSGGHIIVREHVPGDESPDNKLLDYQNEEVYKDEIESIADNGIHLSLKTNNVSVKENQHAVETESYSDMGVYDSEYTTKAKNIETSTAQTVAYTEKYICVNCNYKCHNSYDLELHLLRSHVDMEGYRCELYERIFTGKLDGKSI